MLDENPRLYRMIRRLPLIYAFDLTYQYRNYCQFSKEFKNICFIHHSVTGISMLFQLHPQWCVALLLPQVWQRIQQADQPRQPHPSTPR